MAKSTKELLAEIQGEASDARSEMGSAKTGLTRNLGEAEESNESEDELEDEDGEDEEESEQDFENESDKEDELDEEDEEDEEREDTSVRRRGDPDAAARRVMQKKDDMIADLQSQLSALSEAKTEKERDDIKEEMAQLATDLKLDPEGLSKIATKILDIAERKLSSKLPPKEVMTEYEERAEKNYFDTEWKGFEKTLKQQYPGVSEVQLEQAYEVMDDIAHGDQGGIKIMGKDGKERLQGYPLDYLLFQNKSEFDKILSRSKRHGLESNNSVASFEGEDDFTPDTSTKRGIDALDKKYRDVESTSSGLRRGRSPRARSI